MQKSTKIKISKIYVHSHTHWDREWYQDFQGFRKRLVYMLDELLDLMEKDPEYRYFTLDGQTIVLDDYLEMRPWNKERLIRLIREGRIAVGPWYVMPDEFLVSGESLIRNLQIGFRKSRECGVEPMKSGYVTDIFGHNSQFPQILQGLGIDNAVLFRGFHGDADPAEFIWEAEDGSQVLGLKLDEDRCYSDFYFALRWPFFDRDDDYEGNKEEFLKQAQAWLAYKSERATTDIGIGMDGVDHVEIEPQLPLMLKLLNEHFEVEFVHASLEQYLQELRVKTSDLGVLKGEQFAVGYSGLNNWVPENTLSSRIHLKQHNQHCENLLTRWAEPLGWMTALLGKQAQHQFLDRAWEFLIQNHAHDSICGCSIDQVHQDMMYRFDQSRLISTQIIDEQMAYIADHLDTGDEQTVTVFNPLSRPINKVIEVEIPLPAGTDAWTAMTGHNLQGASFRILDSAGREVPYQILELHKNQVKRYRPYRELPRADIMDVFKVALQADVPPFGYETYTVKPFKLEFHSPLAYSGEHFVAPARYPGSMRVDEDVWDNGRIQLQIRANGTIDLKDHETGKKYQGLLVFEDEADVGDGWTHMAPVTNETVRSIGCQADITTVWDGFASARIRIRLHMRIPTAIEAHETARREETVELPVTTFIDLKKDDPVLYCRTIVENGARDHRFRVVFSTGLESAKEYLSSTPFDLVRRPIARQDQSKHLRKAYEVFPHNGIVAVEDDATGIAVYSKGLHEAIVRDNRSRTLVLTLFRSTAKEVMTNGGDGGQLLTTLSFEYAIRPYAVDSIHDGHYPTLWNEHQTFVTGVQTKGRRLRKHYHETPFRRASNLPLRDSFFSMKTDGLIVSAIQPAKTDESNLILRIWNALERPAQGVLSFRNKVKRADVVNLDDVKIGEIPVSGSEVRLTADAKKIVTLAIEFEA